MSCPHIPNGHTAVELLAVTDGRPTHHEAILTIRVNGFDWEGIKSKLKNRPDSGVLTLSLIDGDSGVYAWHWGEYEEQVKIGDISVF